MSDVTLNSSDLTGVAVDTSRPKPRRAADWPLMGDIVSHRAGVPEHLIRWRRAEREADPDPML